MKIIFFATTRFATLNKTRQLAMRSRRRRRWVLGNTVHKYDLKNTAHEYHDEVSSTTSLIRGLIYLSDLHLDHDPDHQVRSCHNVEVPATHKVCSQVPHRACHQVSTPFSKCTIQTLCQVLNTDENTSLSTFYLTLLYPGALSELPQGTHQSSSQGGSSGEESH